MTFNDIVNSLSTLNMNELDELNRHMKNARLKAFENEYENVKQTVKQFLHRYGELGFGICLYDSCGCSTVLSPLQLRNGDYDFVLYHRDDDDRCEEYGIESEDRE